MNVQIYPILGTHACVVIAIKPITAGEEVTVRYEKGSYYEEVCQCKRCSRMDPTDLSVLKPSGKNDWEKTRSNEQAVDGTVAN